MLEPWLESPGTRARLDQWSEATGLDLERLGTTADAAEITDTAITQPLVVVSALLAYEQMRSAGHAPATFIAAGHSIGEVAAAAIAGVITADEAVMLAAIRGREMAVACALEATGMSAVLGGDETEVLSRLAELDLEPANRNAKGQIVAAGPLAALAELADSAPDKARVRALPVAGAFHTRFMAPARDAVAAAAAKITPRDPVVPLLSNADGARVASGAEVLSRLVTQVTNPVRWDLCSAALRDEGLTGIVELAPAGTLVGIAKREMRGTPAVALKTPADFEAVAALASVPELV